MPVLINSTPRIGERYNYSPMVKWMSHFRNVSPTTWILYGIVYVMIGMMNQQLGKTWQIARFANDWQVVSCYGFYLVPWSLAVRTLSKSQQYLWGLLALSVLELLGYAMETSIAYPGNVVDRVFGERNFTLVMTVGFAGLLPLGNMLLERIEAQVRKRVSFEPNLSRTTD